MPRYLGNMIRYSIIAALLAAFIHVIAKKTQLQITLPADRTYCYTNVQTLSDITPIAECFSVLASGKFGRVFSKPNSHILNGQIIESKGYVIPGLWDSHGHVLGLGETLQTVQLYNSKSMEETIFRVKNYATAHPGTGTKNNWILGTGWDQAAFGRMPASVDLDYDDVLKNMYIMLYRVDSHCIWVSKAVLQLLPSQLPQVPGGEIIGEGVFCDNAMDLVLKHAPKPDKAQLASYLKSAMKMLNSVGLVGVHEAGVTPSSLSIYEELVNTDDWTVRIYAMFECAKRNTFCPKDARKIDREDGLLIVNSVKLFAGTLSSS
jgi:predicted amidohydrolase YtcJ